MSNPVTTGVFEKLTSKGGEAAFPIAVPTCTVIAVDANDPYMVGVIEQAEKHNGAITCVGGKLTGNILPVVCANEEFDQEAGGAGATLVNPRQVMVKTDRFADVRVVTLKKATDGLCAPELADTKVLAMYGCPDHIFVATVDGVMAPKDGEAKRALWIDTRRIVITATAAESVFGAQHDLILAVYKRIVDGFRASDYDLSDMVALRKLLLEEEEDRRSWDDDFAALTPRCVLEPVVKKVRAGASLPASYFAEPLCGLGDPNYWNRTCGNCRKPADFCTCAASGRR